MTRIVLVLLLFMPFIMQAQKPVQQSSAEILESIRKLSVLGNALYVAAHPDDENTRLIAWMANERMVDATYLSLTRGDGGQNLIGPEIREMLGVLRTEELMKARSVDGGSQLFSRANDFGYSKHPDETFAIWEGDEVLADVVWAIRKTRPDIIINRFDHRSPGKTHGHHTASAMLSLQAAELSGDPKAFPEQLRYVEPWSPQRIFFNTSWWFYGSQEAFEEADKSNMIRVDAGVYYPWKGKSNTEIAAESRSMHRCQGFGSTGTRGEQFEYLEWLEGKQLEKATSGEMPGADPFAGIDISWDRVPAASGIGKSLEQVVNRYNPDHPEASISALLEVLQAVRELPDSYWAEKKEKECQDVIVQCMGLYAEAVADDSEKVPGDSMNISVEIISRMYPVRLKKLVAGDNLYVWEGDLELKPNKKENLEASLMVPVDMEYSGPYWLLETGSLGMFKVEDQQMRGKPNTPRPVGVKFYFETEGVDIGVDADVVFKKNDPVLGERYRPLEIVPPATAGFDRPVYLFAGTSAQDINVAVRAHRNNTEGTVRLLLPPGWKGDEKKSFALKSKGQEEKIVFSLTPPAEGGAADVQLELQIGEKKFPYELRYIDYDHIAPQAVLLPAKAKLTRLNLQTTAKKIGYIEGAGDAVPAALRQIGCEVDMLEENDLNAANLSRYQTVIVGIRAYNTRDRIKFSQDALMEFVRQGGTLVVQYNTAHRLKTDKLGPWPLKLSRDRVTDEFAEVRILAPDHPVMNSPNKITKADFDGWVQERGLYFPNEWDEKYTPVISSNDAGSPALDGGMLVTRYGEGWYVYTGYSFFRELPAGVPGAFRLFANLISLGH